MYYEAYFINPQPTYDCYLPDFSQYCLCGHDSAEEQMHRQLSEPSASTGSLVFKQTKEKKKNKAIFKPFIIERAHSTLEKLLELTDKDSKIFK
jgi:hypothetical protein